jgi:hypothetical protein
VCVYYLSLLLSHGVLDYSVFFTVIVNLCRNCNFWRECKKKFSSTKKLSVKKTFRSCGNLILLDLPPTAAATAVWFMMIPQLLEEALESFLLLSTGLHLELERERNISPRSNIMSV